MKEKPHDPNAVYMELGTKDYGLDIGKEEWTMYWEQARADWEDLIPVKPGMLIKARKHMMAHGIVPGEPLMFLRFEEANLRTKINWTAADHTDNETRKIVSKANEMYQEKTLYYVHVLANSKTISLFIPSPEDFFVQFDIVEVKK